MKERILYVPVTRHELMDCLRQCMVRGWPGQYINEDEFCIALSHRWGPNNGPFPGTSMVAGLLASSGRTTVITCGVRASLTDWVWYFIAAYLVGWTLRDGSLTFALFGIFAAASIVLFIRMKQREALEHFEIDLNAKIRECEANRC